MYQYEQSIGKLVSLNITIRHEKRPAYFVINVIINNLLMIFIQ